MENQLAVYDQPFKDVSSNTSFESFLLKLTHPDFHRTPIADIATWGLEECKGKLQGLNGDFRFGGHILHADSYYQFTAPFPDETGSKSSTYRLNVEMQQKSTPSDLPKRRLMAYAVGLLDAHCVNPVYGPNAEYIGIWLEPYFGKTMDCQITPILGSANRTSLTRFYEDPKGWYNIQNNVEDVKESRNNPVGNILTLKFGKSGPDSSVATKILNQLFFLLDKDRDYKWLKEHGITLTEGEKDSLDNILKTNNWFYSDGLEDGLVKGREEGQELAFKSLLKTAKAQGADAYRFAQNLIEETEVHQEEANKQNP